MSEPSSPSAPDDLPTVRVPASGSGADDPVVGGPPHHRMTSSAWGRWTFPEPAELAAQLNGYDVDKLLGRGGMGAVYQGRQHALDRVVAIKVLPLELSQDPEFAERFHREARAMARLDHPNIVRVLEFGKTAQGLLYFTMDYVDGGDLKKLLKAHGPLPAPRAAVLMSELCAALEGAHRRGTIHRDIKPANILLTADGHVRLADFGLARVADADTELGTTRPGMVMGTQDYMAPEQRNGSKAGPPSDVYAAGVVLYQMLTGKLPQGAWEPPSALCLQRDAEVDPRLDALVIRALQEDPLARFSDAGEMRKAVEALLPPGQASDEPGRGSVRLWALAAAAIIMAGAGWLLSLTSFGSRVHDRVGAASISLAAPADRAAEARVVLLDISRLEAEDRVDGAGTRKVTPRDKLLALVRGIAAERPQAIGIDIDFSPTAERPEEPYTPDDPGFFRALLQLRQETGVPVFVGVWRQDGAGRQGWLGGAEFAPLAAGLGIATDEHNAVNRLPLELVTRTDGAALPSLSVALARSAGKTDPHDGAAAALMSRRSAPIEAGSLSVTEFIPNFSSLDRLAWQKVSGTDPEDVPGLRQRLHGNLVMLSDAEQRASDGDDTFTVPARRGLPVPGAYVHACGLVTLLSGAPATLTGTGRIAAGLLIAGCLVGGWWLAERWVRNRRRALRPAPTERAARWVVAGAVALMAFLFMRVFRVVWPDVLYMGAGLLLLRPLATGLQAAAGSIFTRRRKRL